MTFTHKFYQLLIGIAVCLPLAACQQQPPVVQAQTNPTQKYQPTIILHFTTPTPLPNPTATLPEPTATPAGCQDLHGRVVQKQITFDTDAQPFTFRIYLPPCFEEAPVQRYPVVYLIHGQTFADDQWERLGAPAAADELITSKKVIPFMIVMPREDNTYQDIYKASFTQDVTEHLVAWIDSHYPTCAQRECRAIGGLSRGGAWALRLGFRRTDLYSAIGLHSTPPFLGDPPQFIYWYREISAGQMPAVYMDIGQNDPYMAPNQEFDKLLTSLKVPHEMIINKGNHEESYWSAHVGEYLLWYSQHWNKLPKTILTGQ